MDVTRLDYNSIVLDGVFGFDYPDFADSYVEYAEWDNGEPLTDDELDLLNSLHPEIAQERAYEELLCRGGY